MLKRLTTLLASLAIVILLQAGVLFASTAPTSANILGVASHGLSAGGPENVQLAQYHHHHYRHQGYHHRYRRHHHHYGHHHHVRRHHYYHPRRHHHHY